MEKNVRYGWLKVMYFWTIIGAGVPGLGFLFFPDTMRTIFGYPNQDPILFGISSSVYIAFALVSILGFRSPLKFVSVLLIELCYKLIWYVVVVLPRVIAGTLPTYGWMYAGYWLTWVIGNLVAIPFPYVFEVETK